MLSYVRGLRQLIGQLLQGERYNDPPHVIIEDLVVLTGAQRNVLLEVVDNCAAREALWNDGHEDAMPGTGMYCCEGAPGTGKSTIILHLLRECTARQWSAKLLTPTGALRESYVQHGVQCEVDTFDGGTGFGRETADELAPAVLSHDVWIIDEVFNLRQDQWDFFVQAWTLCGRWPCVFFCGDPQQLRPWNDDGSGARMCVHSTRWRFVKVHYLQEPFRCDRQYFRYTMQIRYSFPDNAWLQKLRNECSLDESDNLDEDSVKLALDRAPGTMFMACSKSGVAQLNDMVANILYKDEQPLAVVVIAEGPRAIPLFRGQRLVIMHNIRKHDGLVNGKLCTLLDVGDQMLFVKLRPGGLAIIPVWTFDDGTYFPVLRAHAMTVAKAMGTGLAHVTLFLENFSMAGVGYTALTRIRDLGSLFTLGPIERRYFQPCQPLDGLVRHIAVH